MGRNLPEDIWAVETQWRNMASGASAFSMIAREENLGPMDDATLRYARSTPNGSAKLAASRTTSMRHLRHRNRRPRQGQ